MHSELRVFQSQPLESARPLRSLATDHAGTVAASDGDSLRSGTAHWEATDSARLTCVDWAAGSTWVVGDAAGGLRAVELEKAAVSWQRGGVHAGAVNALRVSPLGDLVTCGDDNTCRVADLESGKLKVYSGLSDMGTMVRVHQSRPSWVMVLEMGGRAKLLDLREGRQIARFAIAPKHFSHVVSVDLCSMYVAMTAGNDVKIWDVRKGPGGDGDLLARKTVRNIKTDANAGVIKSVRFATAGEELLALGTQNGRIWIYDVDGDNSSSSVEQFQPVHDLVWHPIKQELFATNGTSISTLSFSKQKGFM